MDGSSTSSGAAAALREAGVRSVLEVGDDGYEDAVAGFDLGVTVAPDVVVDAGTPGEVAAAVTVAVDRREPVTILGSGHGRLSEVRGGLAITLRSMDVVEVDASAQTVRVGAGCTWDPVLAATTPHGLAAPCGSAPGGRRGGVPVGRRPRPARECVGVQH